MRINLEKTLKREDGKRIRIIVEFFSAHRSYEYRVNVLHCDKGKRTWRACCRMDSWTYRKMSMEERRKAVEMAQLDYVTEQEISAAKLELWESMRPEV